MSIFLSVFVAISACIVAILSVDRKENPLKAKFVIGLSIAITIASVWLVFVERAKSEIANEEDQSRQMQGKINRKKDSTSQALTDFRIRQIIETTNQILEKTSDQRLVIDDVLSEVTGEVTPEGVVINYRLKAELKTMTAIWHFNSWDESFGPSFGDDITIKGLPTEVGENTFIVSTKGMARGQQIPFEIRGTNPYVRAKCDIMLEDGQRFKVKPSDIVSDKVIIR